MNRTIIIAEAGVNHNGDIELALRMIDDAAKAGADYVKFQTFNPAKLVTATASTADYQQRNTAANNQLEMLTKLQLRESDYPLLVERCHQHGIGFLSTPFDLEAIDFLATLHMDYWKIPSGEITNLPYLRHIARKHGRVIMSTGMSTLHEVKMAMEVLTENGVSSSDITLLHCTTQYPTPYDSVNLRAMLTLQQLQPGAIGYSDHTQGIFVPLTAVAMGAKVIEKHFTLDRNLPGPDHKASLTCDELSEMVSKIRIVEAVMGSREKIVTDAEAPNINVARKSIVAAKAIKKGERFTQDNLTVKRPGTGISPMEWDNVIGTTAMRDYEPDQLI
ncbi:MAG: N-acetylneuraminate synthase [Muribaculaceae bacterium]|nr:N-acetylneuraminate synthase [Muribaculaceae bacterium]MDE6321788.1 N-acetylneuraminate synthase [Muribaculaceae bacterium]